MELTKAQWNQFVTATPRGSFLQTWEWGEVQRRLGSMVWRYTIEEAGETVATALVMKRALPMGMCWLYIPHGPVIRKDNQATMAWEKLSPQLDDLVRREHALFVRIDPPVPEAPAGKALVAVLKKMGFRKAEREVQPRNTLVLDLVKPEAELLAGCKPKTRYNIRVAERRGVRVRFSTAGEDVEIFLQLARSMRGRSDFRFHPDNYYRAIMDVLGTSKLAELAIAEHEGKPLAAHLMIYAGTTATYAHGASAVEHKELMAPTYVYWETIKRAKELGLVAYDFYGTAPPDAPADHPGAGVTRMKLGFGGERVDYIGAYDWVRQPGRYYLFSVTRRARLLVR